MNGVLIYVITGGTSVSRRALQMACIDAYRKTVEVSRIRIFSGIEVEVAKRSAAALPAGYLAIIFPRISLLDKGVAA